MERAYPGFYINQSYSKSAELAIYKNSSFIFWIFKRELSLSRASSTLQFAILFQFLFESLMVKLCTIECMIQILVNNV